MMEAAHPGKGDDPRSRARASLRQPSIGRVLLEREVTPIARVVRHVLTEKPSEVAHVKHDHAIQQLPPTAPDPALRHAVLPRTAVGGLLRLDAQCPHCRGHVLCGNSASMPRARARARAEEGQMLAVAVPAEA